MNTDDRCVLPCIDDEGSLVRARHEGAGETLVPTGLDGAIDPELVFVEIDDELERPSRDDPLSCMRWSVAVTVGGATSSDSARRAAMRCGAALTI